MVQPTRPWSKPWAHPSGEDMNPITVSNWKKTFALLPVIVKGEKVWLKYVYKRIYRFDLTGIKQVEYGDIFDVMKAEYD